MSLSSIRYLNVCVCVCVCVCILCVCVHLVCVCARARVYGMDLRAIRHLHATPRLRGAVGGRKENG